MSHVPEKELNPAFPVSTDNYHYEGMTLRDYFAAKAMQGLLASPRSPNVDKPDLAVTDTLVATFAYIMADAMLKEREK